MTVKKVAATKTKVAKPRKKKDPSAPKKALTAYMFFYMMKRKEIVEENPDMKSKIGEVAELIGGEWRQMTDETKAPFQAQANKDKERYLKEKEAAKSSEGEAA
eukprot:GHVU01116345.1.p2 GENE.GHVU01116345.1~~GHVU01116345.1.p2  ORF type:complete len:103 (+),score=34.30 GHVU01116345.1:464-772(+)